MPDLTKIVWEGPRALEPLLVPIGNLTHLPGNPRRGDIPSIVESLREFGQRKPLVARIIPTILKGDFTKRDGTRSSEYEIRQHAEMRGEIEAGNHLTDAAASLGWTHVACVFVDEDELAAKRFALADNRTHDLGSDDLADLVAMLDDLSIEGLLAGTGWTEADVIGLRGELSPDSSTAARGSALPPLPQALWPQVRLLIEPTVHKLWSKMWIDLPGSTDTQKVEAILAMIATNTNDG